jgi:hypothetical protein
MDLQAAKKAAGFAPAPLSDLVRSPQEQAKRERQTAGGVKFDRRSQGYAQESARLYGG